MEPESTPLELALRQRDAGNIEDAIATLMAAASGSLGDAELALTLGKMLAETDQVERAEPWFKHALKLAPNDLFVRMGHGTFLAQVGRHTEARQVLTEVLDELIETMTVAEASEDVETLAALEDLVAATSVNLARSEMLEGDVAMARSLVQPWLANARHWTFAHNVLADLIEREDLDALALAKEGLASGEVSPYMVCFVIERLLDEELTDLVELDRVIGRADAIFSFDWRHSAPELEAALAEARKRYGHAVMRGQLSPGSLPHIAAQVG
ncbi:MAG TPA: hypothetical protein PK095_05370 [Myxococcota bacterium]|nr:hypothetical protein [Myxococcota bacterium]